MICLKHFSLNILAGFFMMLLFTSYLPENRFENQKALDSKIKLTGIFNHDLKGEMSFVESDEMTNKGISYTSLTLKLENTTKNKMAILISKESLTEKIQEGAYDIVNDIVNSEKHTNGAFGYYNDVGSNELPFFTENGKIVITNKTNKTVEGYLYLNLRNANNKELTISGKFVAKK